MSLGIVAEPVGVQGKMDDADIHVFSSNLKCPIAPPFRLVVSLSVPPYTVLKNVRILEKRKPWLSGQRESTKANVKSVHICPFPKTDALSGCDL